MEYAWVRREIHTGFWWETLNEREHLEDLGIGRKLQWIFK